MFAKAEQHHHHHQSSLAIVEALINRFLSLIFFAETSGRCRICCPARHPHEAPSMEPCPWAVALWDRRTTIIITGCTRIPMRTWATIDPWWCIGIIITSSWRTIITISSITPRLVSLDPLWSTYPFWLSHPRSSADNPTDKHYDNRCQNIAQSLSRVQVTALFLILSHAIQL